MPALRFRVATQGDKSEILPALQKPELERTETNKPPAQEKRGMKNPIQYCTHCQKAHGNPVVDLFNHFVKHTCHDLPADREMDYYRAYMAGQHDALAVILKASELPQEQAERVVNQIAIAIRDALLAGIDEANPKLKAQVRAAVSNRFFIREESACCGN